MIICPGWTLVLLRRGRWDIGRVWVVDGRKCVRKKWWYAVSFILSRPFLDRVVPSIWSSQIMSYISFLQQNLALHLPEKMTVCHIFDSLGPCCTFDFLRPFHTFISWTDHYCGYYAFFSCLLVSLLPQNCLDIQTECLMLFSAWDQILPTSKRYDCKLGVSYIQFSWTVLYVWFSQAISYILFPRTNRYGVFSCPLVSLLLQKLSRHSQTENLMPSSTPDQRYACKQCKRWFRNRSGLTQHTHAKHPRFSLRSTSIPLPAVSDELDDHDMDGGDFTEDIAPNHSIRSAFVGPDDALFHNYHPGLTG